jgi:hypothetical protein
MPNSVPCILVIDTEGSAPYPKGALLSCGLVKLSPQLEQTFYGTFRLPKTAAWDEQAEQAHRISKQKAHQFPSAATTIRRLVTWVEQTAQGAPVVLLSDNPAYDAPPVGVGDKAPRAPSFWFLRPKNW